MRLPEYDDLDALGMAELVKTGEVSAAEMLEAAIERSEARNPSLNAVVYDMAQRARAKASSIDVEAPLAGVPFLVKDLKLKIAGTPTSNSTKLMKDAVASQSSVIAERFEAAGLQIFGKTNTPEFGIMGVTEPALRGPCRNPWNLDHTPGGSSGGSASAVAARIAPAAHSGDGGGSIRIPAAACGLVGLKPTRGRVTMAPFVSEAWGGFVQEHVVCHSVRDSAAFLDAVDAPTPGEWYAAPAKTRPWLDEVGEKVGSLTIAYTPDALFAGETHPDCREGLEETVALLRGLGHTVVEKKPAFPREDLVRAYFLTVASGIGWFCDDTAKQAGKKPAPGDFEPATWLLALIGWKTPAPELIAAQFTMQRAAREVAAFFEDVDVFLTPTMARPPAKVGEVLPTKSENAQMALLRRLPFKALLDVALAKMGEGKLAYTPNTQLFNQTGQPGISLPLHWSDAGLPIGMQFIGRFGDEATLFRLSAQLEQARPWAGNKPPLLTA